MEKNNRKFSLMSRRRFIEALTALGVSTAALEGLTKEAFADLVDDPKKEIPVVDSYVHTNHEDVVQNGASPERKPVHRKIPRHQWVRGEAAHDAREQIDRQLAGVPEAGASVTENSNGEDIIYVVVEDDGSLSQNRFREIERSLPHTVDGVAGRGTDAEEVVRDIPVEVDRMRFDPSDAFPVTVDRGGVDPNNPPYINYFWEEWSGGIPGGSGARVRLDTPLENYATSSLATPVEGGSKMITAGHSILIPDEDDVESVWVAGCPPQDTKEFDRDSSELDGNAPSPFTFDGAVIDTVSSIDTQYKLADWSGTMGDIVGSAAKWRLESIRQNGTAYYETLVQQGTNTGRSSGFGIDYIGSEGFDTDLSENNTNVGDSGGPYYIEVTDPTDPASSGKLAYPDDFDPERWKTTHTIAGVHQGNNPLTGNTAATSMYRVEEFFQVEV